MFESNYVLMHKKARAQFESNKTLPLQQILHSAVCAAITSYQKGSVSKNRENDIAVINLIFNHHKEVVDCRKKLDLFFSGKPVNDLFKNEDLSDDEKTEIARLGTHQFKTGFMDRSKLEDYVVATVDSFYEHIIQPLNYESKVKTDIESIKTSLFECLKNAKSQALLRGGNEKEIEKELNTLVAQINTIDSEMDLNFVLQSFESAKPPKNTLEFFFKKNIQPILAKNIRFNEEYSEKRIKYEFKDFLNFHLEKYRQERGANKGDIFLYDEGIIQHLMVEPDLSKLKGRPVSPLLKKHLVNAQDEFDRHQEKFAEVRQVKIKIWEKKQENPSQPQKIIIALHGWRDSVECWNNLGQAAIEKGYKVMAYEYYSESYEHT